MIVLASVTDSLVNWAQHVIDHLGLPGIFLLACLDGFGVPIAAIAIMLIAGVDVGEGHHTILGVVIAGVLGDMLGATIAWAIGRWGGEELLIRHGGKLHLTPDRVARAHGWFERWGAPVLVIARNIPVIRGYIGYPAGLARMDYPRYIAATTLGAIILCVVWSLIGKSVGSNWTDIRDQLKYVDYIAAVVVVGAVVWFVLRRLRAPAARDVDVDPSS